MAGARACCVVKAIDQNRMKCVAGLIVSVVLAEIGEGGAALPLATSYKRRGDNRVARCRRDASPGQQYHAVK